MALHGWCKPRQRMPVQPCIWDEIPARYAAARTDGGVESFHVSMRWFDSGGARDAWLAGEGRETIPYRYWWWMDVDSPDDPAAAVREMQALWRWELGEHGLAYGTDFVAMVSGRKGAKIAGLRLTPPGVVWTEAFATYTARLSPGYGGLLDVQMAGQHVTRAPGAGHAQVQGRWQNPLPAGGRAMPAADALRLAERQLPLDEALAVFPDPYAESSLASSRWWAEVESSYRIQVALSGGMVRAAPRGGARGRRSRRAADWSQPLEAAGLLRRTVVLGERTVWQLLRCPSCERSGQESGAFVTEWGRLYCFRGTCEAGIVGTPGTRRAGGISPDLWMRRASVAFPAGWATGGRPRGSGPVYRQRDQGSAQRLAGDALHEALAAETRDALRAGAGRPVVLAATPGTGKTEAAVQVIAQGAAEGRRTVVAVETGELAAEIAYRLKAALPYSVDRREVVQLVGRNADNCVYPEIVGVVGQRGWAPAHTVCAGCDARDGCRYFDALDGARDRRVIVTTWEQAAALLAGGRLGRVDHVVYDEDPLRSLTRIHRIGIEDAAGLVSGGLGEPALRAAALLLVEVLTEAARRAERRTYLRGDGLHTVIEEVGRRLVRDGRLGTWDGASALLCDAAAAAERVQLPRGFFAPGHTAQAEPGETAWTPEQRARRFPARHTISALDCLARDHRTWEIGDREDFVGRAVLDVGPSVAPALTVLELRRPERTPDLVLDAYASEPVVRATWGSAVVVRRVAAQLHAAAWLRIPVATSRRALADERLGAMAWGALQAVLEMLYAAGHEAGRVLVVTHEAQEEEVARRHPGVQVRHYWQGRGVDTYRTCTAAVAFGEAEVPFEAVVREGQLLFGGQPAFNLSRDDRQPRLWADPRLQAVCDARREAEIAQAVHRVRPVLPVDPAPGRDDDVSGTIHSGPTCKTVVTIGRIDSHLLPVPVDVDAQALAMAAGHVRLLRETGATVLGAGPWIVGWEGRGGRAGWRNAPGRTRVYALADVSLVAAAAVAGAAPAEFEAEAWGTHAAARRGLHAIWKGAAMQGVASGVGVPVPAALRRVLERALAGEPYLRIVQGAG